MWPFKKLDKAQLLGPPKTADYEPPDTSLATFLFHPNRPFFTLYAIDAMLTDARVVFGLKLIRGPILSNARFLVNTQNAALHEFLVSQLNRFWRTSASVALRYMDYGYVGCEVLYRAVDGRLQFDKLKFLHPHTTRVVTRKGDMLGIDVSRVNQQSDNVLYLGKPKCYWSVHQRDQHHWYGRSLLRGAFLAWNEIWSQQGYRDQRRLWFYKNAYAGPRIGYPPGAAPQEQIGETPKPNRIIAQEILDKMTSGGGCTYPNGGEWVFEDARPISIPEGLLEYGDQLRDEIWEGMGIPPEVARAEGTGAYAGRRIPQQAFYASLQETVQDTLSDFDEQVLRPLVMMNFGYSADYEIECFGLLRTQPEDEKGQVEQSQAEPLTAGLTIPPAVQKMVDYCYKPIRLPKHLILDERPVIGTGELMFHTSTAAA